jgi:hypothetical protein
MPRKSWGGERLGAGRKRILKSDDRILVGEAVEQRMKKKRELAFQRMLPPELKELLRDLARIDPRERRKIIETWRQNAFRRMFASELKELSRTLDRIIDPEERRKVVATWRQKHPNPPYDPEGDVSDVGRIPSDISAEIEHGSLKEKRWFVLPKHVKGSRQLAIRVVARAASRCFGRRLPEGFVEDCLEEYRADLRQERIEEVEKSLKRLRKQLAKARDGAERNHLRKVIEGDERVLRNLISG